MQHGFLMNISSTQNGELKASEEELFANFSAGDGISHKNCWAATAAVCRWDTEP